MIKRKGQPALEVTLVKGCPLIPTEQGLRLLAEYRPFGTKEALHLERRP